jgi:hypothetical protein
MNQIHQGLDRGWKALSRESALPCNRDMLVELRRAKGWTPVSFLVSSPQFSLGCRVGLANPLIGGPADARNRVYEEHAESTNKRFATAHH